MSATSVEAMASKAGLTDGLRHVWHGVSWTLGGMAVARLVNYGYKIVITRLGPEAFGLFSLAVTVLGMVAGMASLGLPAGVLRYVPFYRGQGDAARLRGTVLLALGLNTVAGVLGGAGLYAVAPWLAERWFHRAELTVLIRILAVVLPLYAVRVVVLKSLTGMGRMDYHVQANSICDNIVKLALTAALVAAGWGVLGAVVGYVGGMLISLAVALFLLEYRTVAVLRGTTKPVFARRELFSYSAPLFLASYIESSQGWADVMLLGYFQGAGTVGVYSVALLVASVVMGIPELFLPTASPLIIQRYAQGKLEEARALAQTMARWNLLLALPAAALVACLAKPLVLFLFGKDYTGAVSLVYILLLGKLGWTLAAPANRILRMLKKTRRLFLLTLVSTGLSILLNWLWIPLYGAAGAALATCLALLVHSAALIILAERCFPGGVLVSRFSIEELMMFRRLRWPHG